MNTTFWKRAIIPIAVVVLLIAWMFWSSKKVNTIAIVSLVKIDPITQLEDGFKKRIEDSSFGKRTGIVFDYYNAQNDPSLQNQIVDKIVNEKPALVYVLGTPIATAIQKRDPNLIIVQGAVTDPIAAGLANSWEASGKNYAATTDLPPVEKQITLLRQLIPDIRALGLVYNTSEPNSVAVVQRLRKYIDDNKLGIKLEERPVSNTSEVSTATESLRDKVQAIYVPPDNTVHAAIEVLCKVGNDNNIPVFTSVESSINNGALAALSLDYYRLGEQSADIALAILEQKAKPGEIPIKPIENPKIVINEKVANQLRIDLSSVRNQPDIEITNPR